MTALKSFLYIFILVLLLYLLWEQKSDTTISSTSKNASNTVTQKSSVYDADLIDRIAQLEAELEQERNLRLGFEQRLESLEQSLQSPVREVSSSIEAQAESQQPDQNARPSQKSDEEIEQYLINANIPLDTIQQIQQHISSNRLAMLELRDKAIREDWIESLEYSEQVHQLSDPTKGIREQFGDDVFDAYLYASGRNNRVSVQQVYRGSAAETAGIQPGDIIKNYASTKIFSMNDLRQSTVAGEAGETVLVEIIRDNQPMTTTVPRGPLGISMSVTSIAPE